MSQSLGLKKVKVLKNIAPEELKTMALEIQHGQLSDTGVLVFNTGEFTGRSPKDRFIVKDEESFNHIDWNDINQPIEELYFLKLKADLIDYLDSKDRIWMREVYAGAHPDYRISISVYNEYPEANLFVHNMFIEPEDRSTFESEWTLIQAPDFFADPEVHGTRQGNFAVISIVHKTILVGGTGYTGEIKKGIFSVMNYLLPINHNVLSMHCSANLGKSGDVSIFFGLSGTGKTTLSTDPDRFLIGDDEHGWSEQNVFNIEGGCYAKTIDLSAEKEPQIFNAIRDNALVENTPFLSGTNKIDYESRAITENTRVSYPIEYIEGALIPSIASTPQNIFFLTCDAFGVLPPVSKLTTDQAKYYFLSGYTAKIPGTEVEIKEPVSTFSTCFGAPFLPLAPVKYADMLVDKITKDQVNVWMINTGWTGGGYGIGERIKLRYTRAMISAILNNELNMEKSIVHPIFGLEIPLKCPGVPEDLLNPELTWVDKSEYQKESFKLAKRFNKNFEKFMDTMENGGNYIFPEVL